MVEFLSPSKRDGPMSDTYCETELAKIFYNATCKSRTTNRENDMVVVLLEK